MSTPIPIFDPEDPKLTAYALGELADPAERAKVERLLQHSLDAQIAMKDIQELTKALTKEYEQERQETAAETATPAPSNVVDLTSHAPEHQTGWTRPLLAIAAVLLIACVLAGISLPVFHSVQVRGPRNMVQGATLESAASVTDASSGRVKDSDVRSVQPQPRVILPHTKSGAPSSDLASRRSNEMLLAQTPADSSSAAGSSVVLQPGTPALAVAQPAKGEFQNYPGHPGTISLGDVLRKGDKSGAKPESNKVFIGGGTASTSTTLASPSSMLVGNLPAGIAGMPLSPGVADAGKSRNYDINGGLAVNTDAATHSYSDVEMARGQEPSALKREKEPSDSPGYQYPVQFQPPAPALATVTALNGTGTFSTPSPAAKPAAQYARNEVWRSTVKKELDEEETLAVPQEFVKDKVVRREVATRESHFNTAAYDNLVENAFLTAKENPLSTFSIDVDTASYANVRRFIEGGSLPPPDAVRLEELINYFPYDYAPPAADSGKPFAVHLEAAACPWMPEHRLVRIGIKGKEIAQDKRPASNLVFLLDVSGSMQPPERLPLIKRAMQMLTEHLTENDHVAIVTYAGNSGLVLPSTSGAHKDAILGALDRLEAGGSTNGASGITLAYKVAKEAFIKGGTNRVILATDGDFNVGVTSQGDLVRIIQEEAKSGVFLSALGVGTDNYKDSTMQKLADKGNGNYNYIDRIEEARKVLVEQMSGTLLTIAKDVKIQVEFNPSVVGSYRLIGYEKRALRKEDFNDDKIDAGEIGAGHSVTALYEVVPVGQPVPGETPTVDALKYAAKATAAVQTAADQDKSLATPAERATGSPEMLTVKMRHKAPDAEQSERTYEVPLMDNGAPGDFTKASPDFKFAAAVATFGLALRDSPYKGGATLFAAVELAQESKGEDPKEYRAEFINLARRAQALKDAR